MQKQALGCLVALVIASCVLAGDEKSDVRALPQPKSTAAVSALSDFEKSIEIADKAYRDSKMAAEHKLIGKLKVAETVATKAGNLSEANAIDSQIKAALARIEALKSPDAAVAKYSLWSFKWAGGEKKNWIVSDGTVINEDGLHGTWTREGNSIVVNWSGAKERLTIAADGKSALGINSHNEKLTADLIGTNLTGAPPPPEKP